MIVSATNTIEGMKIVKTVDAIDAKSGMLAISARESARKNLEKKAEKLGANGIIGFKIDSIPFTGVAHAHGTAVIVE